MRDNSLARSLLDAGHEVTMLPTYLPHFLDEEPASEELPIFFGGINVYLQHKFSLFRHTPAWLDKALDNKWLLKKAAGRSGMTSSKDLGEITLSTFQGENGPLVKEVRKVVDWFKQHGTPDVILLSTIMLAGIGKVLKRELNIPVYGFLQGEDSFLDFSGISTSPNDIDILGKVDDREILLTCAVSIRHSHKARSSKDYPVWIYRI